MRSGEVKMIKTIHPQLCCVVINPIPLLINFTSFAQLQIKDKLRTFPRREGFTRNKEKISNLICFGPFVILSKPSLPGQGQDRPTALLCDPGRLVLSALQQNQKKECVVLAGSHSFFLLYIFIPYVISGRGLRGRFPGPLCRRRWG